MTETASSPKTSRKPASSARHVSRILNQAIQEDITSPRDDGFDIYSVYQRYLKNEDIPMPIAAILALVELIETSRVETTYELIMALKDGAAILKRSTPNPISLTAGCDLFIQFVSTAQLGENFEDFKALLVREGREYALTMATPSRVKIAQHCIGFIPDDAVVLIHSYSRVVIQSLLAAHKKKRISVYVTEARPRGLGVKAYETLTAAGVPTTLVLDSAVAYIMDKIDVVLLGSEAVVESGGVINAVGSYQMAIIAKAANKPLYALAESYKFLRSFPLSQYDLPSHNESILPIPKSTRSQTNYKSPVIPPTPNRPRSPVHEGLGGYFPSSAPSLSMTSEQMAENPEVDYTRPDLITLVFSDVGVMTPSGVSQYLVNIFAE